MALASKRQCHPKRKAWKGRNPVRPGECVDKNRLLAVQDFEKTIGVWQQRNKGFGPRSTELGVQIP